MLGSHRLQAINDERELEIHRLLGPQGSIVIEDRDPLFGFDELRVANRSHSTDKIYDALLRGTFVPGRKWSFTLGVFSGHQQIGTYKCRHDRCGLLGRANGPFATLSSSMPGSRLRTVTIDSGDAACVELTHKDIVALRQS